MVHFVPQTYLQKISESNFDVGNWGLDFVL